MPSNHGDQASESLLEQVPGEQAIDPLGQRLAEEARALLESSLAQLNTRERDGLGCRFGLHGREPQTLEQLATQLRLARERVCRVQQAALLQLKRGMPRRGIHREAPF